MQIGSAELLFTSGTEKAAARPQKLPFPLPILLPGWALPAMHFCIRVLNRTLGSLSWDIWEAPVVR